MIGTVAAGIAAAIGLRGLVAWHDARNRRRPELTLEQRIARAVTRAQAEAAQVDAILGKRDAA